MDILKSKLRTLVTYMWANLMVLNCRKEFFFMHSGGGGGTLLEPNPFKISTEIIKGSEEDPNLLKLSPLTD